MLFLSLSLHSAAHKVWEFPIIRCLNGADNYTNSAPLAIRFWEGNTSFEVEATLAGTWLDKRERRERERSIISVSYFVSNCFVKYLCLQYEYSRLLMYACVLTANC